MTKIASLFSRFFHSHREARTRTLHDLQIPGSIVAGAIRPCYAALPLALFFFLGVHQASADDTAAVQAAINNCAAGGTVTFAAGTYNIGSPLSLKSNCTYQGQGNPVFMGYQGNGAGGYPIVSTNGNFQNITVNGLTFDGGGIAFGSNGGTASGITITNCTFRNITNTNSLGDNVGHTAISFLGTSIYFGLNVNHNTFTNLTYGNNLAYGSPDFLATQCIDSICDADWGVGQGISVVAANDYNFSDNTFDTIGSDAIKHLQNFSLQMFPHPGPYHIDRNQFYRIHRMAIESQDGYTGFCVTNKTVNNNVLHQFLSPYWGSFGISLMDWCTVNSTANGNEINMIPAQGGALANQPYGIALEAGVNVVDSNIIRTDPNNPDNMISVTESGQMISNNVLCGPNSNNAPSAGPFYTLNVNGNPSFVAPTVVNNAYTKTCPSSTIPTITNGSALPGGVAGAAYSQTFAGSGGTPPYTWYLSGGVLPPGLVLSSTGALSGTLTAPGTWNFTVKLTDSGAQSASGTFTLTAAAAAAPLVISTSSLVNGTMTVPYSQTLTAVGGTPPYSWAVSGGALPTGLSLSAAGIISGTPMSTGMSSFTIQATDRVAATAKQSASLMVASPAAGASAGGVVSDEFNTASLNTSLWTLVAPAGGSQSVTGTTVNLVAPKGSTHDPNAQAANNAVRLEQNIANADFNVVAKFNSLPTQQVSSYNGQGIMVSADTSNFMRFEVYSNQTAGYLIYASSTVAGVAGNPVINAALPITAGPVYLRVTRAGNVWTESWSTDGVNYTTSGTFTQVITAAKIGPYVTNYATTASAAPLNMATVDFFRSLP